MPTYDGGRAAALREVRSIVTNQVSSPAGQPSGSDEAPDSGRGSDAKEIRRLDPERVES